MRQEVNQATWPITWIETDEQLNQLVDFLRSEPLLAIDTETHNWQKGDDHDYLALIQIGVPSKKQTYIIDALAFTGGDRNKEAERLAPMKRLFEKKDIEFIIQYAPFEQRHFKRLGFDIAENKVSDTRIIAKHVKPFRKSFSLKPMIQDILNKEVGEWKQLQTSDWSVRPLSQEQINYAALDVELAYELYAVLMNEAKEKGTTINMRAWIGSGR